MSLPAEPAAPKPYADEPSAENHRAWFQLHLSTCLVLMLAAGALIGANVETRTEIRASRTAAEPTHSIFFDRKLEVECRGWPWRYQDAELQYENWSAAPGDDFALDKFVRGKSNPRLLAIALEENIWRHPEAWSKPRLFGNVAVALIILIMLGSYWEKNLRKRLDAAAAEKRQK